MSQRAWDIWVMSLYGGLFVVAAMAALVFVVFKARHRHAWSIDQETSIWDRVPTEHPIGQVVRLRCSSCGDVKFRRIKL